METLYFLGIDISKKNFQAALTLDGVNMHMVESDNNSSAIKTFMRRLKKQFGFSSSQLTVCMEHTGIYCGPLLDYLFKNGIKVCVEPALQIKQSQGMTRGKSDQADAKRIANYAYKNRNELRFWKPQRISIQKLKALLTIRERLVKTKGQLETPLKEMSEFVEEHIRKEVVNSCQKSIEAIEKNIVKIQEKIDQLVKEDQQLSEQVARAMSVPGVGIITSLHVIIATGEFEKIAEVKKFACYAGVAPFEHSSGSSIRGKTRVSKMANMTLKKLLHLAAISAIRHCEELKLFYERKIAAGKNKMSVINAVRNKLISRIFACIKNKRMYQKEYRHALV